MRVQVTSHSLAERRSDEGAVAIVVAFLAVFLVGISAFTVDLGSAYVSNRNLQKAADAGALAGAQALTKIPGSCDAIRSNSTAVTAAHTAAVNIAKKNYPDPSWTEDTTKWKISCDPQLKVVNVTFGNSGTTPARFTGVFGGASAVTTSRDSQATMDVSPYTGNSVRPLALCSAQVQVVPRPASYPFVRVDAPKNSVKPPPGCPAKTGPGNWWVVDCPKEAPGESTEWQIENGCKNPVSVVPGQENTLTPGELTLVLGGECAPKDDDQNCLSGDTGNIDSGQVYSKWKTLIDNETVSIFPVFCAVPQCSASTIEGTGTTAVYPVFKMVSTIICGVRFSKTERYISSKPQCAGMPSLYTSAEWDANNGSGVNFLLLKYISERTSGSNEKSECALDAECDGGLRRTRLTG